MASTSSEKEGLEVTEKEVSDDQLLSSVALSLQCQDSSSKAILHGCDPNGLQSTMKSFGHTLFNMKCIGLPRELDLLYGSGPHRLALEYHPDDQAHHVEVGSIGSGVKQKKMKTDSQLKGLKGRRRIKAKKVLGKSVVAQNQNIDTHVRKAESFSSSSSEYNLVESKKLRFEDEDSLWDAALAASCAGNESVLNEEFQMESSMLESCTSVVPPSSKDEVDQ